MKTTCLLRYIFFAGIALITACENDIAKINNVTSDKRLPAISGTTIEIVYSDSGYVKMKIEAPILNKFEDPKNPTITFPEGLIVHFYNKNQEVESRISANEAIYFEDKQLWEASNDVEAKNFKTGEQLNTEHLFWDQEKGLIYSNEYCRIINKDGTFYGENGFEATQDLSKWKLKRSKGTVNIKNE